MPDWPDWVWWTIGGVLGALGFALVLWALFADRARGRRRCPKCWYDMSGTPGLTCSECGYHARRERRLFKTRRRRRWAMVSFLLLLSSAAATKMPVIRRGGWHELLPTTVLIYLSPPDVTRWPDPMNSASIELYSRLAKHKLWGWQLRWWISRDVALAGKKTPWRVNARSRESWPEGSDVHFIGGLCRDQTGLWIDMLAFRIRIESLDSEEDPVILVSETAQQQVYCRTPEGQELPRSAWYRRFMRLSPTAAADFRCRVRLILECGDQLANTYAANRVWYVLEDDTVEIKATVRGSIDDFMEPVVDSSIDEVIRQNLWVAAWRDGMNVVRSFPKIPELGDDAALGMVLEIVHDGAVVAKTSGWWGNNNARRFAELLPWEVGTLDLESMFRHPEQQWVLRVTGSADLALRAFDDRSEGAPEQKRFWSGQVEIPLKCSSPDDFANPQREFTVWPDSGDPYDITLRSRTCQ